MRANRMKMTPDGQVAPNWRCMHTFRRLSLKLPLSTIPLGTGSLRVWEFCIYNFILGGMRLIRMGS